jgi:hypothetical protein
MESIVTVLNFIKNHCVLHDVITYNYKEYKFNMKQYPNKNPGIYIICRRNRGILTVLKVGKADGVKGLKQRLGQYISSGKKRVEGFKNGGKYDRTVITMHLAMKKVSEIYGADCELEIYTHEMEMLDITYLKEFKLQASPVRSLELCLSKQAKKENHLMLLSGQD